MRKFDKKASGLKPEEYPGGCAWPANGGYATLSIRMGCATLKTFSPVHNLSQRLNAFLHEVFSKALHSGQGPEQNINGNMRPEQSTKCKCEQNAKSIDDNTTAR